MILRNGIRSNLRARGRTALFVALIFALTVVLSLGLGMWAYTAAMLEACDESFTSVAIIEYMGTDYPDEDAADDYARAAAEAIDDDAVSAVKGIKLWERTDKTLATVEGFRRHLGELPYADYGIFVAKTLSDPIVERATYKSVEELPETCVVYDRYDGKVIIYHEGEPYTIDYYTTADNLSYRRQVSNGWTNYTAWDQLPEEYIAFHQETKEYTVRYNGPVDLYAEDLAIFYYDSRKQLYESATGVPVAYDLLLSRNLYTLSGEDTGLMILTLGDSGFMPEPGQLYLLHGKFYHSDYRSGNGFELVDFYEGCEVKPWLAVESTSDSAVTDSIFAQYAEQYAISNSYVRLEASADVAALEVFQQGGLYLAQGRFPAAGEAGVAVIDGRTAVSLDVEPGDTIELTQLDSAENDRFSLTRQAVSRTLTVVGITNGVDEYEGCVWVSDAEGGFGEPLFGYTLGRAVLDNAAGRAAAEQLQAMMPDQVRVTLYDQGYAAAAQPLQTMQTTALAITVAAAAGALVVLVLFAFLFVGRQRDTVQILSSLGTPKGKIAVWLLSGAVVIAGVAALLGGGVGWALLSRVVSMALTAAQGLYETDLRYSEAAVGVRREMEYTVDSPLWPAVFSAAAVFLLALALCLLFLHQARRQNAPKRGKVTVRTPRAGTAVGGRGVWRYAWRNARRGGLRSWAVSAVALVLCLFLGILGGVAQSWEDQLDALYEDAAISAHASSINGRYYSNLSIPLETLQLLNGSGLVEGLSTSVGYNYWVEEDMPFFGSGYGAERRLDWIKSQPEVIALNDLDVAREFFYTEANVTWLEGYDETVLSRNYDPFYHDAGEREVYPALVSRSMLERKGLALGDTLTVTILYDLPPAYDQEQAITLQIVGEFVQQSGESNIYVPLAFAAAPEWLVASENGDDVESLFRRMVTFDACRFTLKNAHQLDELRDFLEGNKFSLVNKTRTIRTAVVLRDASFTETVGGLGRYITFGTILFPILLAVVGVLGFIVSWLMINSRRMEFAILRGLGAAKTTVFFTFFLEQALLCLTGCLAACAALLVIPGGGPLRWLTVAGFAVCYLAGCALSVAAVGRTKLMELLSERE